MGKRIAFEDIKIVPSVLVCMLMIISLFFPDRGYFLGGSNSVLNVALVGGCFLLIFVTPIKLSKMPWFFFIYVCFEIANRIIHFSGMNELIHLNYILQIVGVYIVIISTITDRNKFKTILNFIVVIFAVYALFGIVESVAHFNIFDKLTGTTVDYEFSNELRFGLARNRGAASVSINNGMMLCLVLSVAAYLMINAERRTKNLYFIAYILIFSDAFLTLSRAVWLQLIVTQILIFMTFSSKKKVTLIIKAIIAIIVVGVIMLIIAPNIMSKLFNVLAGMFSSIFGAVDDTSTSELGGIGNRFELWGWVWDALGSNKLFGYGYTKAFNYHVTSKFVKNSIEVMWLYKLYRTGFFGLIGYIIFQFGSLIYLFKNWMLQKRTAMENRKIFSVLNKNEKISFNYVVLVTAIVYFITQFSCSGFEDLRFFYILISLAVAYNKIFKGDLIENFKK